MRTHVACDRTRFQISLAVDGELSDFERVMVSSHIASCPSCREFRERLVGAVERIREASLEPLGRRIEPPARRRRAGGPLQRAAAAAAFLVVVLGSSVGFLELRETGQDGRALVQRSGPTPYIDSVRSELLLLSRDVDRHTWRRT